MTHSQCVGPPQDGYLLGTVPGKAVWKVLALQGGCIAFTSSAEGDVPCQAGVSPRRSPTWGGSENNFSGRGHTVSYAREG